MKHLLRQLAPIPDEAWAQIDGEARRVLTSYLAARRVVDFTGPLGWTASSVNEGRVRPLEDAHVDGVAAAVRVVRPLVELRSPFGLDRAELDAAARGAPNVELEPLVQAAIRLARAEDRAVFVGMPAAGIAGICERSVHARLPISDDAAGYPAVVAQATSVLRTAGVGGPFAMALGPRSFTRLVQATQQGYPVVEMVRQILGGPVVWAPAIDGAIVVSQRGGDFELTVGQDVSIGYTHHTETQVFLYLVETFTFRVLTTDAAVCLEHRG